MQSVENSGKFAEISGNKGIFALGEAIAEWPHALPIIDFSNCKFNGKALMLVFEKNYASSLTGFIEFSSNFH